MENTPEICHVCGKEKKPYTIIMGSGIFEMIQYQHAREDGPICERCDKYFAMTGDFKDATDEEFTNAEKAQWFANMMLKWWQKDREMKVPKGEELWQPEPEENKREWGGTHFIAEWCRDQLNKVKE
jgi:hypothetical protein